MGHPRQAALRNTPDHRRSDTRTWWDPGTSSSPIPELETRCQEMSSGGGASVTNASSCTARVIAT